MSSVRVQGSAYVTVGSIQPDSPDTKSTFIQVFFNSSNEEEAIRRTAHNANISLNEKTREWLTTLHRWIARNSPIYRAYEQTNKYVPEDNKMSLIFTKSVPSDAVGDPRTFSDPNGSSGPVTLNAELGEIIDITYEKDQTDGKYNHEDRNYRDMIRTTD